MPAVTGKKNQAERYNELGDRHTYALTKYHVGRLFVGQWGDTEREPGEGDTAIGYTHR